MSEQQPRERLEYTGKLEPVFERVAAEYGLGSMLGYEEIAVGYEDYNAVLATDNGRHFVKIFASDRTPKEIARYEGMVSAVLAQGVRHPDVYHAGKGLVYTDESGLSMAVMEYIPGHTYFDTQETPDDVELRQILRQAALINATPMHPPMLHDSWAVQNNRDNYERIKQYVPKKDSKLIEVAIAEFEMLQLDKLPHCFVHGDLTKSNVLKGPNEKIYVLDFSVANWYPRIQELAVISANLLNDANLSGTYLDLLKKVVNLYVSEGGSLTEGEVKALPAYVRAAYAAELIGAHKERIENENQTEENAYWLSLGRAGLKRSLK